MRSFEAGQDRQTIGLVHAGALERAPGVVEKIEPAQIHGGHRTPLDHLDVQGGRETPLHPHLRRPGVFGHPRGDGIGIELEQAVAVRDARQLDDLIGADTRGGGDLHLLQGKTRRTGDLLDPEPPPPSSKARRPSSSSTLPSTRATA